VAEKKGAAENEARAKSEAAEAEKRTCFVVSAFGKTPEDKRARSQVLKHLIKKVLEPRGYEVKRADQISEEGLITNQIIEHLLDDDLVVADLTGHNPNVFYEIAVRHAARKPIVHLITRDESIPFDVGNQRAVQYALDDPDALETAQQELEQKIQAIEDRDFKAFANPITSVRDVSILRESEQPEVRDNAEILGALNEIREELREVQLLQRRTGRQEQIRRQREAVADRVVVEQTVRQLLRTSDRPVSGADIVAQLPYPVRVVRPVVERMEETGAVEKTPGGYRLVD